MVMEQLFTFSFRELKKNYKLANPKSIVKEILNKIQLDCLETTYSRCGR
jgi:hypothetical protein